MSYDFLKDYSEEVVCWYLTIEAEQGKPPLLMGSGHIAGKSIDEFDSYNPDFRSEIRTLTSGVLYGCGAFRTWAEIDSYYHRTSDAFRE